MQQEKFPCPAFSWFSMYIPVCSLSPPCASLSAAYSLLFPVKHLNEESCRNQPENRLRPSSLRQYPEFTKLIHTTLLTKPYERALLSQEELNKEANLGLTCFSSAVQITLEHLYTLHVPNAAQARSISQLQIKVDKCTKTQTNR